MSAEPALLTDADLIELTGYEQPQAQARALREIGVRAVVRKDGHLRVTWEAITRGMVMTASRPVEPDFGSVRRAA